MKDLKKVFGRRKFTLAWSEIRNRVPTNKGGGGGYNCLSRVESVYQHGQGTTDVKKGSIVVDDHQSIGANSVLYRG
jgi:hypothetical protein